MSGWDSGPKRYGYYEDDEEPETVERVVRDGRRALSPEQAEHELARQQEERERREQEREDAELARRLRVPAGGYRVGLTQMRRFVAEDKRRLEQNQERGTDEGGRHGA